MALLAAALAALALSGPARAAEAEHVPVDWSCVAYGSLDGDPARIASADTGWTCGEHAASLRPERAFLRFVLTHSGETPDYLTMRRAALKGVHVMAVDEDGTVRTRSYTLNETETAGVGAIVKARLPQITPQTRYVVAAFDRPSHKITFDQAKLVAGDPAQGPSQERMLLMLTALAGMLLMPLAFNLAFFRVLRQQFLLWHLAMTLTLLGTIVFTSGLSAYFVDLGMGTVNMLMCLIYGGSVATGAMFAWSFIEPDKLHPRLRRALPMCAAWSMAISAFHAAFPFVARPYQTDIYYAAFIPVLAVFFFSVFDAFGRGSRSVKFQIVGWVPLLSVGVLRLAGQLTPLIPPTDAMMLLYFGVVLEVLATTLGVADRFMTIRRQRDMARTEAGMLERLSERDPLTGLLNRRVIEERFPLLRADGFETLAVLDLDRFKQINDVHGHAVGDAVLEAVARALTSDKDTLSFRLGGEEFLLLLRGPGAVRRAERLRQAIPLRVAQDIPELDRVVTSSMGLVEIPPDVMPQAGFAELYARADGLLYQAKQMGRNRTASERIKLFVSRRPDRRRAAA